MTDQDTGNATTQTIYELATKPTFIDRTQDPQQEISWEVVGAEETPLPPVPDDVREEPVVPEEEEEPIPEPETQTHNEEEPESEEIEKKKKKNRSSEKTRISQLTRELRQAQAVTADVINRNQYLESKITQKEKENFTAQENYLTSQKERVKKYLTDALEEGDPAKIAEANDLLGQYNAEILLMSRQKQNAQEQPKNVPAYKPPSYQEPIDDSYQDTGKEWIEKNTWANPKSSHFDQEMYEEADNYSIRLARKYKLEGRGDEVGTTEFFDEITDYIKNSYDMPVTTPPLKQPSKERMQMKTDKSPPVGTVNRQTTHTEASPRQRDMTLTSEQKEIAYSLRGFVRDPKTGHKITDNKTLEEIYKRNLMRGNG